MKSSIVVPVVLVAIFTLAGGLFSAPELDPNDLDITLNGYGYGINTLTAKNLIVDDWYLIFADEDVYATGDIDVFVENVRVIDDSVATGNAYSWKATATSKEVYVEVVGGTDGDHWGLWLFFDDNRDGLVDAGDDMLDAAAVECID